MRPKLRNIGEKWFILSFDLRVFIEKGKSIYRKRHNSHKKKTLPYGDVSVRTARKKRHRYKAMSSLGCPDGLGKVFVVFIRFQIFSK